MFSFIGNLVEFLLFTVLLKLIVAHAVADWIVKHSKLAFNAWVVRHPERIAHYEQSLRKYEKLV